MAKKPKQQKVDFLTFRSHALQSLSLLSDKQRRETNMNTMSKDDIEAWVKKEYDRHYSS